MFLGIHTALGPDIQMWKQSKIFRISMFYVLVMNLWHILRVPSLHQVELHCISIDE